MAFMSQIPGLMATRNYTGATTVPDYMRNAQPMNTFTLPNNPNGAQAQQGALLGGFAQQGGGLKTSFMGNQQQGGQIPLQQPYPYQSMPTNSPYPAQPQYPLQPQQGATGAPGTPAYGLAGANAALSANIGAGPAQRADYSHINANRNSAMAQGAQGIRSVQGFVDPGLQAQQQQAALSGALGNAAQQQAYANFQSSPGQQWLQEQAERGVLRNAAAIGGLGGGNVRQELQRQAMGLAAQDFQNSFNRMGSVADRGIQGAQMQNALYQGNQQAATSAGAQGAGVQGAVIGANAGRQSAAIAAQAALARDRGQYAYGAGQDIGNNVWNTTSALSNLANQQGAGMSDMYGGYISNIANLLSGAGGQQSTSNANLAALLANIGTGAANNFVGASQIPGVQQSNGILSGIGNMAGGVGELAKNPTVAAGIAALFSDARLKTSLNRVGTTARGNPLYTWKWNAEGQRLAGKQPEFGVIAQEVNQDAVSVHSSGYLVVDYSRV